MPQYIEFEDVLIDIVEVKVSRLPFSSHIIGRILYWSKVIDIHIVRDNYNSPWVLTGRPLDTRSSLS